MIVKVQLSLTTTATKPQVLVYNEDRSVEWMGTAPYKLKRLMGKHPKRFFHAEVLDGQIAIGKVAPNQDW